MKRIFLLAIGIFLVSLASELKAQNMDNEKIKTVITVPEDAQVGPLEYFIGKVWVVPKVTDAETYNCLVIDVIFEPATRNNWHKHSNGQILIVTEGTGYYQERGKPVQLLKKGDVVAIAPDIEHWHRATPDSWFSHIALSTNLEKATTEWLEPVKDEYYYGL
jgi:quercetin dioxygenase-like cupin family protein